MGELIAIVIGVGILFTFFVGVISILRWLIRLFRSVSSDSTAYDRPHDQCPVCDSRMGTAQECDLCGWTQRAIGHLGPRRIAARQLRELRQRGLISADTLQELVHHLAPAPSMLQPEPRQAGPVISAELASSLGPTPAPAAPQGVPPVPRGPGTVAPASPQATPPVPVTRDVTPPAAVGGAQVPPATPVPPRPPTDDALPLATPPVAAAERVRRFVTSQKDIAAQTRRAGTEKTPPSRPRRALGEVLSAFMEEKHIRWGELVGGLLIVSSSVALVISFWSEIAERPFLKFGVFNGVTAALFGLGLFAARRWKLPTTSQGVLMTATLLVPLNFLAIAAFSEGSDSSRLLVLGGELTSVAVFTALVALAAGVLLPHAVIPLTLVVIGQSIVQLVIRRVVAPEANLSLLYAISAVSLLGYVAANLWGSHQIGGQHDWTARRANEGFKLLGLSTFATLMPAGLLIFKTDSLHLIRQLSPLAPLAAIPALALGISLWQRALRTLTGIQTAGASIAVCGVLVLIAGLVLAWPQPQTLLPAALVSYAMLTGVALWFSIPQAHLAAAICLGAAYVVTVLLGTGQVTWHVEDARTLVRLIVSATTGNAMVGLVTLLSGMAGIAVTLRRRQDAAYLGVAAAAAAIVSLALVLCFGFGRAGDPHGATWVLALYAVVALTAVMLTQRVAAAWACAALTVLTCIQGIVFRWSETLAVEEPWSLALLSAASVMGGLSLMGAYLFPPLLPVAGGSGDPPHGDKWPRNAHGDWQHPANCWSAACLVVTVSVLVWLPVHAVVREAGISSVMVAWLGTLWLVLAWMHVERLLFAAFQAAITVALLAAIDERLRLEEWYEAVWIGWSHPWALQTQGVALGLLSLFWLMLRLGFRWSGVVADRQPGGSWQSAAQQLLISPRLSVDRFVAGGLVVLLAGLAVVAVIPGIGQELSPLSAAAVQAGERWVPDASQFEWVELPHEAALGFGSWLLWAVVVVVLAAGLCERVNAWRPAGLAISFSAACLLLAGRWEPQVAVASALRWYTAALFGLGSIAIWLRRPILAGLPQLLNLSHLSLPTTRGRESRERQRSYQGMVLLLFVTVTPLVAMATFVSLAAIRLSPPTGHQIEALNWLLAAFAIIGFVSVVVKRLTRDENALPVAARSRRAAIQNGSNVLLVLGAAPLIVMTLFVVAVALSQHPVVGPNPDAFFAKIGLAASYALPLLVFALALVGHAVDQRSAPLAFSAGLLLNVCATAAYLLTVRGQALLSHEQWLRLGQLNAIVAAAFGLAWTMYLSMRWRRARAARLTELLPTQIGIAGGFAALTLLPAVGRLFWSPASSFPFEIVAGAWGWSAMTLVFAAAFALAWIERRPIGAGVIVTGLFSFSALVAFELHRIDIGNWLTFHAAQVGLLSAGLFSLVIVRVVAGHPAEADRAAQWDSAVRWVTALLPVICLFAIRGAGGDDPEAPWWSVGGLIGAAVLCTTLAVAAGRRRYLYVAGLLWNVAVSIWWITEGRQWLLPFGRGGVRLLHLWLVNATALALPVPLWYWINERWIPPRLNRAPAYRLPFHRFAATIAGGMAALAVGLSLLSDFAHDPISPPGALCWLAVAAVTVAATTCLWDRRAPFALAGVYLCGLLAATTLVDQYDLHREQLLWTVSMVLGAYAIATSYLFSRRGGLAVLGERLRIPPRGDALAGLVWLVPANLLLALLVIFLGYWAQFVVAEAPWRLSASQAVIAQAFSVGMLARGRRESQLRLLALWLGVIGAVAFSWSFIAPASDGAVLNRCVLVAVTLAAMATLYGIGLGKLLRRENAWTRAAGRQVPALVGFALASIVAVLGLEIAMYAQHEIAAMSPFAIAAVAVALLILATACLLAALVPGRDPLNLSARQRTVYVYATEAILALLFLHVRLTMPWLFTGLFAKYWPLVVMAIAFLGIGLSEWFHRRNRLILSEPLERTGALLPMLPVLGFWITPDVQVHYSVLLLTVGLLYAGLSVMRRSFGLGLLAALAVNGSLWYVLYETASLGLLEHPQLWLIPPALCVLVAAYLNRQRLNESQMTTVRYLTSTVVYTSSTADVFLNGVGEAPWLPLVLAALSILGILAGIAMRVRAFLFLGTAFLMLALTTIIWYAAVDLHQTWIWFVSGIVMGILIIAVFATIEKKREDVLRLVDRLRQWHA